MKGIAVFARMFFAALTVSAAKLPLPSPAGISSGIHVPVPSQPSTLYKAPTGSLPAPSQPAISIQTPTEFSPVPAEPSILYAAPSGIIPTPSQPAVSVQTPAQIPSVPAELSTLYDAPVKDLPSGAQVPLQVQNSEAPSPFDLPDQTFPAPVEQSTVILSESSLASVQQPAVDFVPVPAEHSDLYEVPADALSTSTQVGSAPFPGQQIPVPQTQVLVVQEPSEPSLYEVPSSFEDISASVQQPALVQSPVQTIPVLVGPSQAVPAGNFQLPSQTTSFGQAVVSQEQDVPVLEITPNNVPVITIEAAPSVPSTQSAGLFQGDILLSSSNDFSQGASVPTVPSGLFKAPVQSDLVPQVGPTGVINEASREFLTATLPQVDNPVDLHQAAGQAIVFPDLVPVPGVPSALYEIPELPVTGSQGRDIISSVDEIAAAASEPVASVTKGRAMKAMPYSFQWGVQDGESGNAFTHHENNDGKTTSGEYRVTLPDGRIQVVNFYDNGDGFFADITYV